MFVDDEEQNLFLMEKIIDWEDIGFRVCGIALDGPEGIQVYEETEPDVVCVDIRMDEMDGLTLIRELQKKGKTTIYIIVTAYGEFSYAQTAISLGVKNYLLKPVSRKEMIPMMKEIKENLDSMRDKERESRHLSREYENHVFSNAFELMNRSCLRKEELPGTLHLQEVCKGEQLRFFELCSPDEEMETVFAAAKEWDAEHLITGFDSIFGMIRAEDTENIIQAFEKLKAGKRRVRYMMLISGIFSDETEFCEIYRQYFLIRNCVFYQQESMYYDCMEISCEGRKSTGTADTRERNSEKNVEEAMHTLVYNASVQEMEKLVVDICSEEPSPEVLTDRMIELLIMLKSQLTRTYQDRAFMVLRHQNLWDLHRIRTRTGLERKMKILLEATAEAVRDILDHRANYTLNGKIMDYIWENFSRTDFSAGEVAEKVHLSRNYFLKLFKDENKMSFWDYVTSLRMEKAKKLLKASDDTLYTISMEIGYESQYHFSRKFKNYYGISPNEYRNR